MSAPSFTLAALLCALPLAAGCCYETERANVQAVSAPDSLAPGQTLVVKVYAWGGFQTGSFRALDDTTFRLSPTVGVQRCGPRPGAPGVFAEEDVVLSNPPARRLHVRVLTDQGEPYDLTIEGGMAPALIERHRVELRDPRNEPTPGVTLRLVRSTSTEWSAPQNTFDLPPTDAAGATGLALPCPPEAAYYWLLRQWPDGSVRPVFSNFSQLGTRMACGVPEHIVLRTY